MTDILLPARLAEALEDLICSNWTRDLPEEPCPQAGWHTTGLAVAYQGARARLRFTPDLSPAEEREVRNLVRAWRKDPTDIDPADIAVIRAAYPTLPPWAQAMARILRALARDD